MVKRMLGDNGKVQKNIVFEAMRGIETNIMGAKMLMFQ
jgi:hypothetical protein